MDDRGLNSSYGLEPEMSDMRAAIMAIKEFNRSYMLLIIAVGLTGNFISVVIFQATDLRKTPSSHYLTALAVSDSGVLLGNLVMRFRVGVTQAWFCKLLLYIQYVSLFLSVWFVVAFTTERLIAVCFPLKLFKICTVRRARGVIAGLTLTAAFLNSYVFIIVTAERIGSHSQCMPKFGGIYDLIYLVCNYVDTAVTMIIPMISIVVLNMIIAVKVTSSTRMFRNSADDGLHRSSNVHRPMQREYKITKMLLIVSLVFILMNLPDHIARIVGTWVHGETVVIVSTLTNAWFNTGFAINFFLYSAVGVRFRFYLKAGIAYAVWRCTCEKVFLKSSKVDHRLSSDMRTMSLSHCKRMQTLRNAEQSRTRTSSTKTLHRKAVKTQSEMLLPPPRKTTMQRRSADLGKSSVYITTETHF